jgi:hypothetical protein
MKHDLTTGTWQDDTGCPISIILATTSDESSNFCYSTYLKQKLQGTKVTAIYTLGLVNNR